MAMPRPSISSSRSCTPDAPARASAAQERPDGSLNTTALVHEAYLKLVDLPGLDARSRTLLSAWRPGSCGTCWWITPAARRAAKRGLGESPDPRGHGLDRRREVETIAELDEALQRLEAIDERRTRILEQRYLAGSRSRKRRGARRLAGDGQAGAAPARAWLAVELQREFRDAAGRQSGVGPRPWRRSTSWSVSTTRRGKRGRGAIGISDPSAARRRAAARGRLAGRRGPDARRRALGEEAPEADPLHLVGRTVSHFRIIEPLGARRHGCSLSS